MKKTAREKLAERNMSWDEKYTKVTARYKQMYADIIGKGSYFRWEGKDVDSGDEYFVVVGPAKIRTPKAEWFAGCRKLPSEWAAGGQYFSEIKEAMNYAHDTWGVSFPSNFGYKYDSSDLKGISDKMEEWRKQHKEEKEERESAGENNMEKHSIEDFDIIVEAQGGPRWWTRTGTFHWWSIESIDDDKTFAEACHDRPSLLKSIRIFKKEHFRRQRKIMEMYGPEYKNADFYKIWLVHNDEYGTYIIAIGPYCADKYDIKGQARDKFGVFKRRLNKATQEEIDENKLKLIKKYEEVYGIVLDPSDIFFTGEKGDSSILQLTPDGRKKLKESPQYKARLSHYGVETEYAAKQKYVEEFGKWKEQRDKAFQEALKSGKAFEFDIPPPPRVDLITRKVGQQQFSKIEVDEKDISETEGDEAAIKQDIYGFDSIQQAVDYAKGRFPSSLPIPDVPPTTSENLEEARTKYVEETKQEREELKKKQVLVEPDKSKQVTEPIPPEEKVQTQEAREEVETPVDVKDTDELGLGNIEDFELPEGEEKRASVLKDTILNLVKVAKMLDDKKKYQEAEEVHKILRKYL